ncbi:homoserine dehydrogenase [Aeropyrum camini SY1 = JCM 12091]|uniref:homoserine dehydrogenase n=1 Tax=Aeropyrum camini SY1 = JCM 12091 TaxID=1198449 RepID=U3TFW5_9CREN|nr:homoserine dehydrogenase [Aeropyrum camini SY1 = JCM 12091]
MRVVIAGFGSVGRRLASLLLERGGAYGLSLAAALDSRGHAIFDTPGCVEEALKTPRGGLSGVSCGAPGSGPGVLEGVDYDALVLTTASSPATGEPGLGYARAALEGGRAVVAADKPPVAMLLLEHGGPPQGLFYKATVMAGTPLIDLLRVGLAGRRVLRVVGVLNGTSNYILNLLMEGVPLEDAVDSAARLGIAEPDPSADLGGVDLALKASIISQTLGCPLAPGDVEVRGTVWDAAGWAPGLRGVGVAVRYTAVVDVAACRAVVGLTLHRVGSRLYSLPGSLNAAVISLEDSTIYLEGPGAGLGVTASTLLSDLVLASRPGGAPPYFPAHL